MTKRIVYLLLTLALSAALCVWWETAVFSRTVIKPDGSRTEYTENARGNVLHKEMYDETGRWVSAADYTYDALGRVTRVDQHRSGVYELYTYGDGIKIVEEYSHKGKRMQTLYSTLDSYGRTTCSILVYSSGTRNGETHYTYGADGSCTVESHNTDGVMTNTMTFDKSGRLLYLETVGAFSTLYFYEEGGCRTENYDAEGKFESYSLSFYDERGVSVRTEEYDADGTLTAYYEEAYTDFGTLAEWRGYTADGTLTHRRTCFYDEDGVYLGCERQSSSGTKRYNEYDRTIFD